MSAAQINNLAAAREIAAEMQRGEVSTSSGMRHITDLNPVALLAAWSQAGQIIEGLAAAVQGEGTE